MPIQIEERCRDYGREGCLEVPDERFTLYFEDIGELPLKFCAECGPGALRLHAALMDAIENGGPEFRQKLDQLITGIEIDEALNKS